MKLGSSLFSVEPQSDGNKKSSGGVEFSLAPSEGERAGVRGQDVIAKPAFKLSWRTRMTVREPSPLPCLSPHPQSLSPSDGAREDGVAALIQSVAPPKIAKNLKLHLLILALLLSASGASAQYSIDWFTIDGGGGTSTGGVYSVSGTIGQPDAGGPMTNGQYSVTGGFWALPTAIQVTGAPTLTIVPATPGTATISWTPNTPGFVLQETLSLSPTNWVNSPSGATNPVVVSVTQPTKFYRLFKP